MAIPTTEPASVVAGDSVTWSKSLADYPASAGWVLSYTLISAAAKISISASASGDDHLVAVAAATTAGWTAGDYQLLGVVTKGAERYSVASGRLTIAPNLAALTTYDARSTARKMLEAYEAAYLSYITNNQGHIAEYEIAGRRVKFRNAAEIWQQVEKLRLEVRREEDAARIAAGLTPRRRILARFSQ